MSGFLTNTKLAPNPCFIVDEDLLEDNMTVLKKLVKKDVKVLCALKGFAMWEVFPQIMRSISGGTASSLNEALLVNETMKVKAHSCFVVYTEDEFEEVQDLSSHVTFNSLSQFSKFKNQIRKGINYGLRVNPEYSNVQFEKYNPCMPGSRFGIRKEQFPKVLPSEITGLHFHALCESSAEDFSQVLSEIETSFGDLLHQVSWVNFGGGHHITKKNYDVDLLSKLLTGIKKKYKVDVIIEPGEAIGLNAGFLLSKVEDLVENKGEKIAVLNVSFAAHMPDCLEMPYKPDVIGERSNGIAFTLGGNTCMSGDFVKGFRFQKELNIGDDLIFTDMAHYTFVKTNFFNGVKHPSLGLWTKEGVFKLLRNFGYEEFKARLS